MTELHKRKTFHLFITKTQANGPPVNFQYASLYKGW